MPNVANIVQSSQTWAVPNAVQNPIQQVIQRTIDAEYISVALPSNYVFYDFKDLKAQTFKRKHLRKLLQAQENRDPRAMAEVLNSVITCEKGYTDLIYRLTPDDYTYLLWWERVHSLPAMPYVQVCMCQNEDHIRRVESGELKPETLRNNQTISKANLDTIELPKDYKLDLSQFMPQSIKEKYPQAQLRVPLNYDWIDMLEYSQNQISDTDSEDGLLWFMTGTAACLLDIDLGGKQLSYKEKFDLVDNLPLGEADLLDKATQNLPKYGVQQLINVKCTECGAVSQVRMVLNAHSFLPSDDVSGGA